MLQKLDRRRKKQINSVLMKGIIRKPLLSIFLNKYPMPTEPKIAAIS